MLALSLTALTTNVPPQQAFYDYLALKDESFRFEVEKVTDRRADIKMTSLTWQGVPWRHTVAVLEPRTVAAKGTAILYITGGEPNMADLAQAQIVAEMSGLPIAILFNIPNQPIWDMKEDDLIAHTFEKYLETKDPTWPLLFPMTKSAIRAMDAVQSTTKQSVNPISKFVVTGFSKRGWTTWFVGAAKDKRVVGIAPCVIDNLNVGKQMRHQIESWGEYSAQIQDYTRRGLQAKLDTADGKFLSQMIDPYTYRAAIKAPTLIVNGGNDPYWTVDALSNYVGDLKQPTWTLIVPNAGHGLGDLRMTVEAIRAFAKSCAGEFQMPKVALQIKADPRRPDTAIASIEAPSENLRVLRTWLVASETLDFRPQKWEIVETVTPEKAQTSRTKMSLDVHLAKGKNYAVMVEARLVAGGTEFSLTSPAKVFKRR
ncbi:MAG: hypothetical protein KF784_15045 [Fimbriimonadaceae bacterium]|nr:hypothetical protein [Fimbriimonadaceae bacterium]